MDLPPPLLEGRTVLVTGAGRGIGAAIARTLAAHGARVAVNYLASEEPARRVVTSIEDSGGTAAAFRADVRDAASVERMAADVLARFGRIDGVVNNAIAGVQKIDLADSTAEDYRTSFDFGCLAVINTISAVRPVMRRQQGGRVVNVVTEVWDDAPVSSSVYLAGKGAMVGISRALARELGPENITVNMVAPGWMIDDKPPADEAAARRYAAEVPLRRRGAAEEVGNACVFLLSELAAYITGAYLPVTGGRVTQLG